MWSVEAVAGLDLPYASRVKAVRIAKQALSNARLHAAASRVSLTVRNANGGLEVAIADDGVGVDPASVRSAPDTGAW